MTFTPPPRAPWLDARFLIILLLALRVLRLRLVLVNLWEGSCHL